MPKYLVGNCPKCGAVNAGAVWMDDFTTDEDWQETRTEFEESGLIVSEVSAPSTLEGCRCKDQLVKAEKLAEIGLKNNPCQGCGAYYPAAPPSTACAAELDNACEWIKLHDAALSR